jgi:hypothetical protein
MVTVGHQLLVDGVAAYDVASQHLERARPSQDGWRWDDQHERVVLEEAFDTRTSPSSVHTTSRRALLIWAVRCQTGHGAAAQLLEV